MYISNKELAKIDKYRLDAIGLFSPGKRLAFSRILDQEAQKEGKI